jgi:hypothetical protein
MHKEGSRRGRQRRPHGKEGSGGHAARKVAAGNKGSGGATRKAAAVQQWQCKSEGAGELWRLCVRKAAAAARQGRQQRPGDKEGSGSHTAKKVTAALQQR